ncbi:LytR family transcriptional regulator [Mycolicibacterium sp. 018/SC-01/001]|uniref:LytR C-terminal domain-containing protein n=1 Tax=Mycolicibacterium sp. 018/SC-01/001 TaxID=2592069 RepID=UPI00117C02B7|nr:LytR C-terminal domain-containing protein [Mycolicibacterium sp. 018/SC-01/001]TRW82759.1 LytR family transcriptional regulator [Mycolicibacterium sp. 018/SC-01/001]
MNQRESSGLPLRAMVMVLLFLGVVFLLVAFQSMGSSDDDSGSDSIATSITSTPTTPSTTAPPAKSEVRVFNISSTEGAAQSTADRLREAGWNVTETGNLALPDTTVTTVFFSDAPGEQKSAEEIGRLLEAPVAPRVPELTEQPPGVIVAVTG